MDKPDKDGRKVVTHCKIGGRAAKAADLLIASGVKTDVYKGSFNDWKAQEGPVDKL